MARDEARARRDGRRCLGRQRRPRRRSAPRRAHGRRARSSRRPRCCASATSAAAGRPRPRTAPRRASSFSCPGFTPKQNDLVEIGTATSPTSRASAIGPFVAPEDERLRERRRRPRRCGSGRSSRSSSTASRSRSRRSSSRGVSVAITAHETIALGALGDGSAGYRVVATLTTQVARSRRTSTSIARSASGRTITEITISQFQKPPPLKWEIALAKIAARRIGRGRQRRVAASAQLQTGSFGRESAKP